MDKICGTCLYLGEKISPREFIYKTVEGDWYHCDTIEMPTRNVKKGRKAFVHDKEDYQAILYVETDFGCLLWEAKE